MENDFFWAAVKQRAMIEMESVISELTTTPNSVAPQRLRATVIELLEIAETKKTRNLAGFEAAAVELGDAGRVHKYSEKIQNVTQKEKRKLETRQRSPREDMKRRDDKRIHELNQSFNTLTESEDLQGVISQPSVDNLATLTAQYSHLAEVSSENKQALAEGLKTIQTHVSETKNSLNALREENSALQMKLSSFDEIFRANQRLTSQNKYLLRQLDLAKADLDKSQWETRKHVSDLDSLRLALELPLASEDVDQSEEIPMIYKMREEIAALRESSQLSNSVDQLGTNTYSDSAEEASLVGEGEALRTMLLIVLEFIPDISYPIPWMESVFLTAFMMQGLRQDILSGKNAFQKFRELHVDTQGSWFCLTSILHTSETYMSDNTVGCIECREQNYSGPCVQLRMHEGSVYFRGTVIRGQLVEQMHD